MGRDAPMNTNPVTSPPSRTVRTSATQKGQMIPPRGSHSKEYGQTSAPTSYSGGSSKAGNAFSTAATPGGEYRQVTSNG